MGIVRIWGVTAPGRHSGGDRFGLAELIDFEAQLIADKEKPAEELVARDRAIALRWEDRPRASSDLAARWVASLRDGRPRPTLGERIESAYTVTSSVVFVSFVLVGVAVALAVLQFTGDHPINVLVVLGVFVFLQLLNLLVTLAAFAWSRVSPGFLARFPVGVLVRWALARIAGRHNVGRFLARRSLYPKLERWALFRTMQIGAVAFNIGAIATFVAAVSFTDLAFAWSTTLRIGSEGLQRFCELLATPWQSWVPEAVPTLELVQSTQYFRLERAYVNAPAGARVEDAAFAGGWWPFLLMCLLVYGLLPRLLLAVWGGLGMRRALGNVRFDTPDEMDLIARLQTPRVRRPHEDDPGNVSPLGEGHAPLSRPEKLREAERVVVVRWRDAEISDEALSRQVEARLGGIVTTPVGSAGGHDHAEDEALLERLRGGAETVVIVAEPWNAPDRAFERFVRTLREGGDSRRRVYVLLTDGGDDEQRTVWSGSLAELADPYIALGEL